MQLSCEVMAPQHNQHRMNSATKLMQIFRTTNAQLHNSKARRAHAQAVEIAALGLMRVIEHGLLVNREVRYLHSKQLITVLPKAFQ